MIKDLAAYRRLRVEDDHEALRALDLDASIAIVEALLTSSVMGLRRPRLEPRQHSLARTLGIAPERLPVRAPRPR